MLTFPSVVCSLHTLRTSELSLHTDCQMSWHRMFVYGTLKQGQPNHYLMQDPSNGIARLLGEAKLTKRYPLVIASQYNIPCLLPAENEGKEVYGELYEVDSKMLECLDRLEDHPRYYIRTPTQCFLLPHTSHKPETGSTSETTGREKLAELPTGRDIMECEVYFLRNFRKELLELPCLSRYDSHSSEQKAYVTRERRNSSVDVRREMQNIS